jgi:hypothetical protein
LLGHLVAQEIIEELPNILFEKLRHHLTGGKQWWKVDENNPIVTKVLKETFIQVNKQSSTTK